jgi:hypothetical protein
MRLRPAKSASHTSVYLHEYSMIFTIFDQASAEILCIDELRKHCFFSLLSKNTSLMESESYSLFINETIFNPLKHPFHKSFSPHYAVVQRPSLFVACLPIVPGNDI